MGCLETSVRIYHFTMNKTSKEGISREKKSCGLDSCGSAQHVMCFEFQEGLGNAYRLQLSDYEFIGMDSCPSITLLFSFFINQTYAAFNYQPIGISNSLK